MGRWLGALFRKNKSGNGKVQKSRNTKLWVWFHFWSRPPPTLTYMRSNIYVHPVEACASKWVHNGYIHLQKCHLESKGEIPWNGKQVYGNSGCAVLFLIQLASWKKNPNHLHLSSAIHLESLARTLNHIVHSERHCVSYPYSSWKSISTRQTLTKPANPLPWQKKCMAKTKLRR